MDRRKHGRNGQATARFEARAKQDGSQNANIREEVTGPDPDTMIGSGRPISRRLDVRNSPELLELPGPR